jgi:hypothetical protein
MYSALVGFFGKMVSSVHGFGHYKKNTMLQISSIFTFRCHKG